MVKLKSKQLFRKMVLVPFEQYLESSEKSKKSGKSFEEIDFSKEIDSPFMKRLKQKMKEILRKPGLSYREKSRLYNNLLQKYRFLRDELANEGLRKEVTQIKMAKRDIDNIEGASPDEYWWDGGTADMSLVDPVAHHEMTENADDFQSLPENLIENEQSDMEIEEFSDNLHHSDGLNDEIEEESSDNLRKRHLDDLQSESDVDFEFSRKKHADAVEKSNHQTPKKQVLKRLDRKTRLIKTRREVDLPTFIDHRFKDSRRKRPALKLVGSTKSWLGRRKSMNDFIPAYEKYRRIEEAEKEENVSSLLNKQIQFRKNFKKPPLEKHRIEPRDHVFIDQRFRGISRKRPSSKIPKKTRSWLGRVKDLSDLQPASVKFMKLDAANDGKVRWSQLK